MTCTNSQCSKVDLGQIPSLRYKNVDDHMQWMRDYNSMTEQDRKEMKADEIFALYLYRLSTRFNKNYYKNTALPFVILFRECLNEYGWAKHYENEKELEKNKGL